MAEPARAVQPATERRPVHDEADVIAEVDRARFEAGSRLGEVLLGMGALDRARLDEALARVRNQPAGTRRRLGEFLVEQGWVSADEVNAALAHQFGIPRLDISSLEIRPDVVALLPQDFALGHEVLPLAREGNHIVLAMADPMDEQTVSEARFRTGCSIERVLADAEAIGEVQNRYFVREAASNAVAELSITHGRTEDPPDSRAAAEQARRRPVVRLVDSMLLQAVHRGASDIHIRPEEAQVTILFRVDGKLQFVRTLERELLPAVVARIKIAGGMDVAEHRLPQDGHLRMRVGGRRIDMRVSVMPTSRGESLVIRVLDRERGLRRFGELGFGDEDLRRLRGMLSSPNGMVLVTGPTGSGKSTTLYAMLEEVRRGDPHIITVEDPVEYDIRGVEQIQVQPGIGYTFAEALRHILRHDPDVIMVGEIRDLETARIANKAALTGHLVLSTLHTNDAASAVTRLIDMGVEPYLIGSTLLGAMAQRLIRLNCAKCVAPEHPDPLVRETLAVGPDEVFQAGTGCPACNHTGYRGRTVVYELLPVTEQIRDMITRSPQSREIKAAATGEGMIPLTARALQLAREGRTSLQEVFTIRI